MKNRLKMVLTVCVKRNKWMNCFYLDSLCFSNWGVLQSLREIE